MEKLKATIYHNPRCGTSRRTLEILRDAGIEPRVVEYLQDPPSREETVALIRDAQLSVRDALRIGETRFVELGLDNLSLSDEVLLDAIEREPILLNRPFVRTALGARLCRPAERVLEILPAVEATGGE